MGFTWFLNNSIAGVGYLLSFSFIWVLVVVEVAGNDNSHTWFHFISQQNRTISTNGSYCLFEFAKTRGYFIIVQTDLLLEEINTP